MDKNLQQFPKEDMFNPWKPWAIGAVALFAVALLGFVIMDGAVPSWYRLVPVVLVVVGTITLCGCTLDNKWIKVPKNLATEHGYWHVTITGFSAARPGNWDGREMKELIYLFEGMPIEITYFDESGTEKTRQFRVRFNCDGVPRYARYLVFYKWYLAIPKTKEAAEYVMKPTTPFFSIEPTNAPATPTSKN